MNDTDVLAIPLRVHLLPDLAHPHELAGNLVVVADILRATTTLTAAFANGVRQVIPCLEVPEARNQARRLGRLDGDAGAEASVPAAQVLLGGERGGERIAGFDLGNSPAEYSSERVAGKSLVFTTTNGTRALMRCVGANRVLLGCFGNLTAVARLAAAHCRAHSVPIEVICAGTEGEVSWEDTLFAGALTDRLVAHGEFALNDAAQLARHTWRALGGDADKSETLAEVFRQGKGGQKLLQIQRQHDLPLAAQIDQFDCVAELDLTDWTIRVAGDRAG